MFGKQADVLRRGLTVSTRSREIVNSGVERSQTVVYDRIVSGLYNENHNEALRQDLTHRFASVPIHIVVCRGAGQSNATVHIKTETGISIRAEAIPSRSLVRNMTATAVVMTIERLIAESGL